ncbi:hypothetical protein H5410_064872 [Solanum commersonii]|uniref:Serine protease inhibitor, potato inhibitor I-type family protein n=1 Tax=Solanum commersonii TaxID=4109 RepID=A0A9J5VY71_SOLCO|nr:hypothetical protein H5410_064872 [Solanum commersonii]
MFKNISLVIAIVCAIYSSIESRNCYPPCMVCKCIGNDCAGSGLFPKGSRYEWPELVATHEKDAVNQVLNSNSVVTAVVIYKQVTNITDICCNRVWIYVDVPGGNGIVQNIPAVG